MSSLKTLAKNGSMDFKERCKSFFNNEMLSDIKFVLQPSRNADDLEGDSKRSKMEIPAHKFLLSICSPVFFAMFCGEMAETKEHIDLPDCEYEGMLELLRYIYTDEVCLNGDNVMQVLYRLAEKYMITGLAKECAGYLGKNLDLSNVFFLLKHAQQYDNKDLLGHCWEVIDQDTELALESNEFLSMDRSSLNQLVERNSLSIREVELFKAVDCWAKEECKRQQLEANGPVKRQVLGEQIVKNIRFPIMSERECMDVVLESKILTEEESGNLLTRFIFPETSVVGFLDVHRQGPLSRCCRFKSFLQDSYCSTNHTNWFPLEVDKNIMLHGLTLLGNVGGEYTAEVQVSDFIPKDVNNEGADDDDDDDDEEERVLVLKKGTFTSTRRYSSFGYYCGFAIIFDEPYSVEKENLYFISIELEGPNYLLGDGVTEIVHVSGVEFNFNPNMDKKSEVPVGSCAELLFKRKACSQYTQY